MSEAPRAADAPLGWRKRLLFRFMSWWPPLLGAGIRVRRIGPGLSAFETEMRLRPWNRNYVGTHYGGSLYSMADPFYMLLLIERLGPGYVVWDKEARIRFRRPGRGTVRARFEISAEEIDRIRREAAGDAKVEPAFRAQVVDGSGEVVAEIEKVLHVRRR